MATALQSPVVDRLAIIMLAARIAQTTVRIALAPTNAATTLRFALFFVQVSSMITMGVVIAATLAP
jgi:hypothetical protein